MTSIQNRSFLGAIAAAIVALCKTFIRSMSVAEDAVEMAEMSVNKAKRKLKVDLAIEESTYVTKAVTRAALAQAREQKTLAEFSANEDDAKRLKDNLDRLQLLVNKELASLEIKEE